MQAQQRFLAAREPTVNYLRVPRRAEFDVDEQLQKTFRVTPAAGATTYPCTLLILDTGRDGYYLDRRVRLVVARVAGGGMEACARSLLFRVACRSGSVFAASSALQVGASR